MAITSSFQNYDVVPSAVIADGPVAIPLWAVTAITLSETYHLPPIGSAGARAVVATHDDTVSLSGLLVGTERYAWKAALESAAESSRRGGFMAGVTGGAVTGLILLTSMTIRTDMQVKTLSFSATAARRDTLAVSVSLVHMPRPSALARLFDLGSIGIGALADFGGN
jgi:hypothetical protein